MFDIVNQRLVERGDGINPQPGSTGQRAEGCQRQHLGIFASKTMFTQSAHPTLEVARWLQNLNKEAEHLYIGMAAITVEDMLHLNGDKQAEAPLFSGPEQLQRHKLLIAQKIADLRLPDAFNGAADDVLIQQTSRHRRLLHWLDYIDFGHSFQIDGGLGEQLLPERILLCCGKRKILGIGQTAKKGVTEFSSTTSPLRLTKLAKVGQQSRFISGLEFTQRRQERRQLRQFFPAKLAHHAGNRQHAWTQICCHHRLHPVKQQPNNRAIRCYTYDQEYSRAARCGQKNAPTAYLLLLTCLLLLACFVLTACALPSLATPRSQPTLTDVGAPGLDDPIYPYLGNGGYDVTHYAITLAVEMDNDTISGATTIQAQAFQPLRRFNLDFLGLAIDAIHVNDDPVRYQRTGSELTVTPAMPLADGQAFTVTVTYHGQSTPITDDPAVPRAYGPIGWLRLRPGLFVISEPSGAMSWYPGNNHPSDKATYTFTITVAKPYVVAANGLLVDERDHGATHTYVWSETKPMASYLATLVIAEFEVLTDVGPDGMPIRHYLPPAAAPVLVEAVRQTPAMLRFFTDLLGPYPFAAYGVAVIDDPEVQIGLEAQTLTILPTHRVASEQLHELAHQWFGNSVTPATWQETWLNEGFATYCEWLWVEQTQGQAAFDTLLRDQYAHMARAQMGPPALPPPDKLFGAPIYIRGAWSLHALRLQIGDTAFFALLREWVARYQYANASTADFMALAEEVSGQSLAEFFQAWLYDTAVPPLPEGF
jgi:hypothetical protein